MRAFALGLAGLLVTLVVAGAAIVAFNAPTPPPPMTSVETAFDNVDFSALPPKQSFVARDGTHLAYRLYKGDPKDVVVLIHGSSGTSSSMHVLAQAINARGATVYTPSMRGHDNTGRYGDIDYIGQLDDDLVDFMKQVPAKGVTRTTLLGFSSGGGFVLQFAGGKNGTLFDRYVLVSPQMSAHTGGLMRPNGGGWVSVAVPRIVVLSLLTRAGIHNFEGLPVINFAVAPGHVTQTSQYTFRMLRNFGPSLDYEGDLRRVPRPISIFAGANDEIFYTTRYNATLKPVRPDLAVTIVPGMGHMDMIVKPKAVETIAESLVPQAHKESERPRS
jgi:pimeloyl-ACP methyl ester carboxylesterase